jgi:hypothetical protein
MEQQVPTLKNVACRYQMHGNRRDSVCSSVGASHHQHTGAIADLVKPRSVCILWRIYG